MARQLPRIICKGCSKEKIITQTYQFKKEFTWETNNNTINAVTGTLCLNFCTPTCCSSYFTQYLKKYERK